MRFFDTLTIVICSSGDHCSAGDMPMLVSLKEWKGNRREVTFPKSR